MVLKTRFETLNWWSSTSGGRRSNGFHFWGFALTPAANFEPALVGQLRLLTSFDNFVLYTKRPGSTMQCSSGKTSLSFKLSWHLGCCVPLSVPRCIGVLSQKKSLAFVLSYDPQHLSIIIPSIRVLCIMISLQVYSVPLICYLMPSFPVIEPLCPISPEKKEGDQLSQDLAQWSRCANTGYRVQGTRNRCARAIMTVPVTILYFLG